MRRTIKPRKALGNATSEVAVTIGTTATVIRKAVEVMAIAVDDMRFESEQQSVVDRKQAVLDAILDEKALTAEASALGVGAMLTKRCKALGL